MADLTYSSKVKQAQMAIHYVMGQVQYRGLNTIPGWIRNPLDVPQKFVARITNMAMEVDVMRHYAGPQHPRSLIRDGARIGIDSNTGNCSELSAIAFEYLERMGVRPLEYFAVYRGSWNHAFVVLYRDGSIPVSDFDRWSYDAVVCDPLYDRAADAGYLPKWYPNMFPLRAKDIYYRVD